MPSYLRQKLLYGNQRTSIWMLRNFSDSDGWKGERVYECKVG